MRNILLCGILVCGWCCSNEKSRSVKTGILDTLHTPSLNLSPEISQDLLNDYYLRFGIAIPKYYSVRDSLAIDLNKDRKIDTIIFLSPVILEDSKYSRELDINNPKRVLVEIISNGESTRLRNVYDNLTSDIGGVLSTYSGLYLSKRGFEIRHMAGAKFSWTYVIEFSTQSQDSIFLARIEKTCSFNGVDDQKEYFYEKMSVSHLNINDTINADCNCDNAWMRLEGGQE